MKASRAFVSANLGVSPGTARTFISDFSGYETVSTVCGESASH
jgi:hypothetical protein